ncbi:hypothetical protein T484DRAFT_1989825 [Baffinella frigidus]|nr:hypothetical protein T484DRAFT_1989825 [Cryptophyta sp. CCMP2293]
MDRERTLMVVLAALATRSLFSRYSLDTTLRNERRTGTLATSMRRLLSKKPLRSRKLRFEEEGREGTGWLSSQSLSSPP